MAISIKSIVRISLWCAALGVMAACSPRKIPPLTISDLMEDRVKLDGVLMKCNQRSTSPHDDIDCINARIAAERLEAQKDQGIDAKRAEEFERNREQLRSQQDRQREELEAKKVKVDAYHLPLVPVEPSQPPKDPQSPIVGSTTTP
jgi:uncharacterized protein YkuJ